MMPTPILSQALPADARSIIALIRELTEIDADPPPALSEAEVQRYLAAPGNCILLAEVNGQPAGLLSYTVSFDLWHAGECCLIRELIVSAAYRRQGIASCLLEEVFRRAETAGWQEVSVSTLPDNQAACALYRRHGMTDEVVLLERHFSARPG